MCIRKVEGDADAELWREVWRQDMEELSGLRTDDGREAGQTPGSPPVSSHRFRLGRRAKGGTRRASTVSTAVHKGGGSSSVGGQGASPGEWCMSSGGGRKCWVETQQHQLLCFPCGKDTCLRRFLAQY